MYFHLMRESTGVTYNRTNYILIPIKWYLCLFTFLTFFSVSIPSYYVWFVLVIFCFVSTTIISNDHFQWFVGQWQVASNPCLNNPYGALNFPHPSDNAKFLQCGLNARLYIVQCPADELYDQATATCITAKVGSFIMI